MFSSTGGNLQAGFTMYELLRSLPVPVTMCNVGSVESIAVIVYLGASIRIAAPKSTFKLHGFSWTFNSNVTQFNEVSDAFASLCADVKRYTDIFKERTQGAKRKINIREYLRGKTLLLDADEAAACAITTSTMPTTTTLDIGSAHIYP